MTSDVSKPARDHPRRRKRTLTLGRPIGTTDPLAPVDLGVAQRLTRRVSTDHLEIGEATAHRIVGQAPAWSW
ncbi:hypothetical protein ACGFYV_31230 [Streptomyces sp. NPDC048297]|uniref:hypothetical protein n=1 Tax=Streptomyces sp. NPDC048297 TaxID=3365531 RepID=UPI00371C844B